MDPRKQRSRDRLYAAALGLAAERPVSSLTVTQIAEAAGVHRSTFYEHAESPEVLVQAALTAELDALRAELMKDRSDAATAVTTVTEGVLRHILRHVDLYRRELADGGGGLHAMLSRHFRGTTAALLERGRVEIRVDADGTAPGEIADAAARFLADGTVGVIDGWLRHPDPRVEDFLRLYLALLPTWWPHRPPG
ncbi:TetR/AcrR family transcriptional regulator [Microbacterium sp. M3]|uniref:TetR/AcrR family transcriptional regulator n=1 Tax=Microbacterium arthrosphaerae TaxID=792652 RepID=A0ABU4GXR7_9MICO|nr:MULTISPECIES: TetR/AcrR family transcriptional regulator [Microbacterium]MDW4571883.1 TetR/AcrR family transcriptional regulator [Microbacterium arthrosphaerae]MDW7605738.1 TetR/AcrR family transcriptional regulator [Microbacterium sp. M3]